MSFFNKIKVHQANATPTRKPRCVTHPFNTPQTMPVKDLFPPNFDTCSYHGPAIEMVPKVLTPGLTRNLGVVGNVQFTYHSGGVTVQGETTASLADLAAYHDRMLLEGQIGQAKKVACLANQMANGVPENKAAGITGREGVCSFYKRVIPQEHQTLPANNHLNQNGNFTPFARDSSPNAQMAEATPGRTLSRTPAMPRFNC